LQLRPGFKPGIYGAAGSSRRSAVARSALKASRPSTAVRLGAPERRRHLPQDFLLQAPERALARRWAVARAQTIEKGPDAGVGERFEQLADPIHAGVLASLAVRA
jgi:hypothetical protein